MPEIKMPEISVSNPQVAIPQVSPSLFTAGEAAPGGDRRDGSVALPRLRSAPHSQEQLSGAAGAELYSRVRHEIGNRFGAAQLITNVLFELAGQTHGIWLEQLQAALLAASVSVDNALLLNQAPSFDRRPKMLNELLSDIPIHLCELAAAHKVTVRVGLEGGSTLVDTDLQSFQQVISNLALNSIQAMPMGGEFRVRASCRNGRVILRCTDTGYGIPEEIIDKVFEVGTSSRGSAGLGLAASRLLLELQGGCISVESTSSEGTCIRIELPEA